MRRAKFIAAVFLTLASPSCGILDLGGVSSTNDPEPNGEVIASGSFSTVNQSVHDSKDVSGSIRVYRDFASGVHVVRLESLNAPNEPGSLILTVTAGGNQVLSTTLKATRGNQNYPTSIGAGDSRSWTHAAIRSATWPDPATADYGHATLVAQ